MNVNNNIVTNRADIVSQHVIDNVEQWHRDDLRRMFVGNNYVDLLTQLEAIFIVGNLRRELLLEHQRSGYSSRPHTPTILVVKGSGMSDEAMDVFAGFLQETPCHLMSLILFDFQLQKLRRLLPGLHPNTSVKKLQILFHHENDAGLILEDLFRHKTDFTDLDFSFYPSIVSPGLPVVFSGLTHLTKLSFYSCDIGNQGVQAILQGRYPSVVSLYLDGAQITSDGLGFIARHIRQAFPILECLVLSGNPYLLNSRKNTQLFADNVLPVLKELHMFCCGDDSGYVPIIKACVDAETIGKLEVLSITQSPSQTTRNQLIENLPKMKVKHLRCYPIGQFTHSDQGLMSALYNNTTIVQVFAIDDETRHHIAPICQRNKILANIDIHLLLLGSGGGGGGETTTSNVPLPQTTSSATTPTPHPAANNNAGHHDSTTRSSSSTMNSVMSPLGRWSRVLAEVGHHERVPLGATPVYKILQAALAPWLLEMQQPQLDFAQQQVDDHSRPIELETTWTVSNDVAALVGECSSLTGDTHLPLSVQNDVADDGSTSGSEFQPEQAVLEDDNNNMTTTVMDGPSSTTTTSTAPATTAILIGTKEQRSHLGGGQKRGATMNQRKTKKLKSEERM